MAIVDVLDYLPPTQPELEEINTVLRRVADGIVRWQDPQSGAWWQVVDQGARQSNYLEATASSMFVYTLAKAINRGYLPREKYLPAARRGYEALIREFVCTGADGRVSLTRCCSVAGLGYTNAAGRARDGSFEYYVSEPIVDNDLKGVGPFILAGIEMQQLLAPAVATTIHARSWDDATTILARIKDPVFPAAISRSSTSAPSPAPTPPPRSTTPSPPAPRPAAAASSCPTASGPPARSTCSAT
jgi:unsaturated rhamnogalacturonyl hydrolase